MNTFVPNIQAEVAVIGSCLTGSYQAVNQAITSLEEEYFSDQSNKTIFRAIRRISKMGNPVDFITVLENLTEYEKRFVKQELITKIHNEVPNELHVPLYAQIIKKNFAQQKLNALYQKLNVDPFDMETQREVRQWWDFLNYGPSKIIGLKDATQNYAETLEKRAKGKLLNIHTGYKQFDALTGGLHEGNMVVIGANTSVGKTTMLLNFALPLIRKGHKVLFISAEMVWDELLDRIVGMETDIFPATLRRGRLTAQHFQVVNKKLAELSDLPMWCVEGGRMSIGRIRLAVETLKPTIIMVDYIQRFTPQHPNQSRPAFFSDLANDFKALALEKKILVFAASQFSRDREKQDNREPLLSDLKESGGLEEAADVVVLMSVTSDDEMMAEREIKFHVKKNRHGPCGSIQMRFDKTRMVFKEHEPIDQDN